MESNFLLEMQNIGKYFPGVRALDGVTLRVRAGSVHALMGENGAGKSTLMKCLFGIYRKDTGTILLDGREVSFKNPLLQRFAFVTDLTIQILLHKK